MNARTLFGVFTFIICMAAALSACAEDSYYQARVNDLKLTEGKLPKDGGLVPSTDWMRWPVMVPRVEVVGTGEAYFVDAGATLLPSPDSNVSRLEIVVRAPEGKDVTGVLTLRKPDQSGMVLLKFNLPASSAKPDSERAFRLAKTAYYQRQAAVGIPGTAWFRHMARAAGAIDRINSDGEERWQRQQELERQFSLFSGGRALSENLQLNRQLAASRLGEASVALDTLTGISVAEIDWKPLLKDAKPKLDPLASAIPADQQAVFFPSFAAMARLADEANNRGTALLRTGLQANGDARIINWYQNQLGVSLDGLARAVGPKLVTSVAITGSDPYFPTGTDVAVILASPQPPALKELVSAQMQLSASKNADAKRKSGEVEGISYTAFVSPDRRMSSYLAVLPGSVVITNSPAQLQQLAQVASGKSPAIASLDEFKFFRERYLLGDPEETAFVFLSDATIRRLCSPRWRIGTARRTYAAAVLAELQAQNLTALVQGTVKPGPLRTDLALVNGGELSITPRGVMSSVQGTLDWQTPIVELDIKQVTADEAAGYNRWRDQYQSQWRWAFDPIGLRLGVTDAQFSADLTVMPLIAGTEYRQFIDVSKGASLKEDAGDRHGAPLHAILAINKESELFQQGRNMASVLTPDPFDWLGSSVSMYVDDDPIWGELAKLPREELRKSVGEKYLAKLPIAIRAEVSNPLKLTAFLATLRGFIEQTAPGMMTWENRTHKELSYVRIAPTPSGKMILGEMEDLAIYYAPSADDFVVTLNEPLMKRSLERKAARQQTKDQPEGTETVEKNAAPLVNATLPWLGKNLCVQIDRRALEFLSRYSAQDYRAGVQIASWNNLPILNEWKRRFPKHDPVALHEQFWQAKLVCPGGGKYVWNDKWETMESTACGHPGEPKAGPTLAEVMPALEWANFGLTFEQDGLRGRVQLQRK